MFNRIRKTFREKETSSVATNQPQISDGRTSEQSGFICPICMISLKSPEDLQRHFDQVHANPDQSNDASQDLTDIKLENEKVPVKPPNEEKESIDKSQTNGVTISSVTNQTTVDGTADISSKEISLLHGEINDLKASLTEEKWYSTELKKELDALKEEKENVSEGYDVQEKQLTIAVATNEELAKQKEVLEKKAAQMAQTVANVKADQDELRSQKAAVEERCKNQSVELEKAAAWVRDLESQLPPGDTIEGIVKAKLQRPGADDVMVLKKELVSVQTLMDQLTQESEEKGKEVEKERQHLQKLLDEANEKSQLVQKEFDAYKMENVRLKSENIQTEAEKNESLRVLEEEKEKLHQFHSEREIMREEELKNLQASLEKEQLYSQSLEAETSRLQEDKVAMKDDIDRLSKELDNFVEMSKKENGKSADLLIKLKEVESAKDLIENELVDVKEQLKRDQDDNISKVNERTARVEALTAERDDLLEKLTDSRKYTEEVNQKHSVLVQEHEELRQSAKQSESENRSIQQQLDIEVAQMKIKMEALQENNKQLSELKTACEKNLETLRNGYDEERNSFQVKQLDLERQLVGLKLQNSQLENEKVQNTRDLDENRNKLNDIERDREEMQARTHSLNTDFALKVQEIETMKDKLAKSSVKLEEEISRREKATEEATKLREERTHLLAQMEAGEGEAAAKAHIAEENELLRKQKDEAEQKLREEMSTHENATSNLTMKLSDTNMALSSAQEQVEVLQQLNTKLKDDVTVEREKFLRSEADLKAKIDLLASAEATSLTQRADIESHLSTVKRSLDEKILELSKCNDELVTLRVTNDELKNNINQLRQDHHVEMANIRIKCEGCEREREEALTEIEIKKKEIDSINEINLKENKRNQEELKSIEAKHAERVSSLQLTMSEVKSELTKKSDDHQREESLRIRTEVELNQVKRQLKDSEDICSKTQANLDEALSASQKVNEALVNTQNLHEKVVEEAEKERCKLKRQMEELQEKMQSENNQLEVQISDLQKEILNHKTSFANEQAMKLVVEKSLQSTQSTIVQLESNLEQNSQALKEMESEKGELEKRLTLDVDKQNETIKSLKEELAAEVAIVEEKENLVQELQKKVEDFSGKLHEISAELEERTTTLTETEVDLENTKTHLNETKLKLETSLTRFTDLENDKQEVEKTASDLTEKIDALQTRLSDLQSDYDKTSVSLKSSEDSLQEKSDEFLSRKLEFDEQLQRQLEEISQLKSAKETMESELVEEQLKREQEVAEKTEEIKKLKVEGATKESMWSSERESNREKMESLETAQKLLINHKVELQKTVEGLQADLNREKKVTKDVEERTEKNIKLKDAEIDNLKTQLINKAGELETAEADRVVAESRLQLEIGTLSENLNSTRSEWVATTQKLETMTSENDDLRGQVIVFNATIQSNADERRALLERCLNAEQTGEQLNSKVGDLRRKLEEAHSAMHELGRENQALQVKHTTTISRQWADDRATNQCKACGRSFSITVRKHHCRHCGEIFCNECSSRTATVAASKNPVRVCERCYDDLLVAG